MAQGGWSGGVIAFSLVYLTFFLDNVLLTVLVPIIPDWVGGARSLRLWQQQHAPLASLLNSTLQRAADQQADDGVGGAALSVGSVLGAKAATQLVCAPLAAAAVAARGPVPVLQAATAVLAAAALLFAWCGGEGGGGGAAWCAGAGRAAQGAGAAGAAVAGMALCARAIAPPRRRQLLAALLGAVALGVLVGYPFGSVAGALWSAHTPFLLIAAAFSAALALQYTFLDREIYSTLTPRAWSPDSAAGAGAGASVWASLAALREPRVRWACGAVALTTSVMAALEPCLPLWLAHTLRPTKWTVGFVFIPDSAGYLIATSMSGALSRRMGISAECLALCGQAAVGGAALLLPLSRSLAALSLPHAALGLGLGATDAALVPALLSGGGGGGARVAARAAALSAAGAAAYALGPALGGALSAAAGFGTMLRALAVANLLYAVAHYRQLVAYPLTKEWGATSSDESEDEDEEGPRHEVNELVPLRSSRDGRVAPIIEDDNKPTSYK